MSGSFVFNHHSLPFSTKESADEGVSDFLKICINAKVELGLSTILVAQEVDASWFRVILTEGYYWKDWFNQNKNNKDKLEEVRIFRSIETKSPLIESQDVGGDVELFDVREKSSNERYMALRAAAWYDHPLCSFPTQSPWDENPLKIMIEKCSDQGEFVENEDSLMNISSWEQWESVKGDLLQKRNAGIESGRELWNQRGEIFPKLKFCGKAPAQLQKWDQNYSPKLLDQVKSALSSLNRYVVEIEGGGVEGYSDDQLREIGLSFKVSGESPSVRTTPSRRKQREFYLPDGRKKFFERHIKLSAGFRLYFFPDPSNSVIYIGYIGVHPN